MTAIFSWLAANIWTILICAALITMVVLLIRTLIRDKKTGKSCCGGCSGCSMSGSCHSAQKNDK